MRSDSRTVQLFRFMFTRYVRERYLANVAGPLWVILVPLAQLGIYAYVFVEIFKARVPQADLVGFVPYLALAFWPWTAFADSVVRSSQSVVENRDLIGKVAMPSELLPLASVSATYLLTLAGYVAVLATLAILGTPLNPAGFPILLVMLTAGFLLAAGIGWLLSAVSVYFRDLQHALGPIFMLWFFATPILYSIELIPDRLRPFASLNPMYYQVKRIREVVLFDGPFWTIGDLWFLLGTLAFAAACLWLFRRMATHFEDYL